MLKLFYPAVLSAALFGCLMGCDVEQTREGEMPDVNVDVEPGRAPAYDVDAPEVDVTSEERTVTVPDVDVTTEEETITVPDVDVTTPEDE